MQTQSLRRLLRNNRAAGACVENKTQRLFASVHADVDDGTIIGHLERHTRLTRSAGLIETALGAEITQEINQSMNPRAAIFIRARRDDQETLVGIGSLFVTLGARRRLRETVNEIRLVGIECDSAAQPGEAGAQTILVEINHRQTRNRQGFVVFQAQCRAELFDRQAKVTARQND